MLAKSYALCESIDGDCLASGEFSDFDNYLQDDPDLMDSVKQFNELLQCSTAECRQNKKQNRLFLCEQKLTLLCQDCLRKHQCLDPFTLSSKCCPQSIENIGIFKSIKEVFPKLCKYSDKGCTLVSALERHELLCEFRPIKCLIGEDNICAWSGTVKDWQEHVDSFHKQSCLSSCIGMTKKLTIDSFKSTWGSRCYRLIVEDNIFILFMKKTDGQLYQGVRKVSLQKHNFVYHFTVCFKTKSDVLYKYTVKSMEYDDDKLAEDLMMSVGVPIEDLNSLVDDAGGVEMNFQMARKETAQ